MKSISSSWQTPTFFTKNNKRVSSIFFHTDDTRQKDNNDPNICALPAAFTSILVNTSARKFKRMEDAWSPCLTSSLASKKSLLVVLILRATYPLSNRDLISSINLGLNPLYNIILMKKILFTISYILSIIKIKYKAILLFQRHVINNLMNNNHIFQNKLTLIIHFDRIN
jgi:hypothetical protein